MSSNFSAVKTSEINYIYVSINDSHTKTTENKLHKIHTLSMRTLGYHFLTALKHTDMYI